MSDAIFEQPGGKRVHSCWYRTIRVGPHLFSVRHAAFFVTVRSFRFYGDAALLPDLDSGKAAEIAKDRWKGLQSVANLFMGGMH